VQYAEQQALEMLYRHQVEFALDTVSRSTPSLLHIATQAVYLVTRVMPSYEVP